jgi:membrane-associated phospholipid phosphatase
MTLSGATFMLNRFDVGIERWMNYFSGRHPLFDKFVLTECTSNLTTSVFLVFLIWLAAFDARREGRLRNGHELIFGASLFAMLATVVARAIALSMPFRTRPYVTPSLHFNPPAGGPVGLIHWSSFPSDHATLFFALAIGILPVSRRLGWLAVFWVAVVVCIPLIYIGQHWPTDILAGAILGGSIVQLAHVPAIRQLVRQNIELFYARRPALFFALFFLWSYETSILYDNVRKVLFFTAHRF